jgi:hypothetical protein
MTNRNQSGTQSLVTPEMLQDLPEVVQRYLNYTAIIGKPQIDTVYLRQTGKFRQGLDRPWMPMSAEQWYTTNPPGFLWKAQFKLAGLPLLHAQDKYQSGQGHMFGKLAGLFTVFNVRGEKLDQGAMLRYLSEMIWFPSAFLDENITWKSRDDHTAEVTFTDHGKSVSGLMHFDETGEFTNFTADRYREIDGDFSLDPWATPVERYGVLAGLNLPVHGKAVWNLPEGDFAYVELEITEIKYNTPA